MSTHDILVIQSHRSPTQPAWLGDCCASVQQWAALQGYGYRFAGDELLDMVPPWYRHKVGARLPIVTDLARLLWIQQLLDLGEARAVVWLDADTLVFAPRQLQVQFADTCVFGLERWLQRNAKSRWQVRKNVHNAYCGFQQGCPVLPFLIQRVQRLIQRVDAAAIPPQLVGPKLLTSLHNTVGFAVDERFGAISPELCAGLLRGEVGVQAALGDRREKLGAANLCASLASSMAHEALVDLLSRHYSDGL